MMKHATNTFSPVPAPLARFGHGPGPFHGDATSDYSQLMFRNVRRPIYRLDVTDRCLTVPV